MASSKEYLDFILEKFTDDDRVRARKMMGEYLIYVNDVLIGGIYDDELLLKPTPAARRLLKDADERAPYDGAKKMLRVDRLDDPCFLRELFNAAAEDIKGGSK